MLDYISSYSARYIKEEDESTSDVLKSDDVSEKKNEEDNIDPVDDMKSKEITGEKAASGLSKADDDVDDDEVVKEKAKGTEVHRRGSKNRHFWEIWRRYSEFELLRNFLQTVYPHVSLCLMIAVLIFDHSDMCPQWLAPTSMQIN